MPPPVWRWSQLIRRPTRFAQNPKGVLLMRHRRGVSLMACGGGCRIEPALESLLYHGSQGNPSLGSECQSIPILEWPGVESSSEEETDGIRHKLPTRVGVAAKEGRMGGFFDAVEEDFMSVGSQVGAAEQCVIGLKDGRCGLAIDHAELT